MLSEYSERSALAESQLARQTDRSSLDPENWEAVVSRFGKEPVYHPALRRCLARLQTMHLAGRLRPGKPIGMLVTGLTGTGKSTIAKLHEERHPRFDADDRTVIPVLRVELPGQPTAKVIGEHMLLTMRDPLAQVGSAEFKLARVRKLLRECRTELVIIDEFQHLTNNLVGRPRDIAADTIKNLMNDTGLPFVFIGAPSCRQYFVGNQELSRRCTPKIHLTPFGFGSKPDKEVFMRLLKSLDERLPFSGPSSLVDPACVPHLHIATFGLLGLLAQLVEEALRIAVREGRQQITNAELREAFSTSIYEECPPRRNPFDAKFNGAPLTRPGEPFCGFTA